MLDHPSDDTTVRPVARPAIVGEVLFDSFDDGSRVLGGAPFNVAWHLKGFGADPLLITAVGTDPEGREILERMEEWGLATDGVQVTSDHPTGRVDVFTSGTENRFEIVPDQAWDHIDLPTARRAAPTTRLLYHGSLALRGDPNWRALQRVVRGDDAPPTFVDLNLRDPWTEEARVEWCLAEAQWLKLNDDELARVTSRPAGTLDACRDAAIELAERYDVPRLIVTRGVEGALCVTGGQTVTFTQAPEVEDVADTVGAGDAFSAVVFLGIYGGWSVQRTLDRAARFAADVCRIRGATTLDQSLYARHFEAWSAEDDWGDDTPGPRDLYVLSLTVHGLVRSEQIELGRDADTGGQVSYVIDQARALAAHPAVDRVDVVTRLIEDRNVDDVYAEPFEPIAPGAQIVRLPFGPRRYLHKETLWPYLEGLLDQLTRYVRGVGRLPDIIHAHYADAGYVGAQLAKLLGVPFLFTGHSLGRDKLRRLLEQGQDPEKVEERYRLSRRIEAEEVALETAALVFASTGQEIDEQYERYDHYAPSLMRVVPPGVDLSRFSPPTDGAPFPPIREELKRFLTDPDKPMVLAIARPDERKNFAGLLREFGSSEALRDEANLVLIAGSRSDIQQMERGARRTLQQILFLVDRYDLYGSAAYPKTHGSTDIPDLYRLAARTGGVFVNPALTEPFGLTLIEAAASGLPVVATNDGGPLDIIDTCENGLLVDVMEPGALARGLEEALSSRERWAAWSRSGAKAAHAHYSWESHADRYVEEVQKSFGAMRLGKASYSRSRLLAVDRILVTDIDDTLTGDLGALSELKARLRDAGGYVGFGIATGRSLEGALQVVEDLAMPSPDVLITGSGTQLHYGKRLFRDRSWERQIRHRWDPDAVRRVLDELPGVSPGDPDDQTPLRLRYVMDPDAAPSPSQVRRVLRQSGVAATAIVDHGVALEVIPARASPGLAIRFFAFKWDLPPERLLVAGDSGNDADMIAGDTLGVVVGNHTPELEELRGRPRVFFADAPNAGGILEGIDWYGFFDEIRPDRESPSDPSTD